MAKMTKAAAYHGVQNMRFAPRTGEAYATGDAVLPLLYAKSINPSALLEAQEQYADNRLLFRVPSDKGYEGEIGTTAPDPELDKAAGFALEGAGGLIATNQVSYPKGALYYEFIERDADGQASVAKVWLYNVEIGKGSGTHSTDTNTVEFGTYSYPFRVYGDTLMAADGAAAYQDAKGLGRTAMMYTCRPGDEGFDTFGDSVPAPKVAAPAAG